MKYRIHHITSYHYGEPFANCHNQVRLTPRELPTQHRISSEISVEPRLETFERHVDSFGNIVESFSLDSPSDTINIQAISEVEVSRRRPAAKGESMPWERMRDLFMGDCGPGELDPLQYVFDSPMIEQTDQAGAYVLESFKPGTPILTGADDLMRRINTDFKFDKTATTVGTSVSEVFKERRGVCQDFAHLMIVCLRALGLPGRYVSGYLQTEPVPGRPRLIGADASHAWCSTWCPKFGWRDFDPTNNCCPNERHITLAWGRDYGDVSPVRGVVLGGAGHHIVVSVDMAAV